LYYGSGLRSQREINVANENESLEKTVEAGLVALLTVATQIREGKKGEPTQPQILEAKHLFNEIYTHVAG
jgi:hypothetical protein